MAKIMKVKLTEYKMNEDGLEMVKENRLTIESITEKKQKNWVNRTRTAG